MVAVLFWLAVMIAAIYGIVLLSKAENKRRKQYNIPANFTTFRYMGGHPTLQSGSMYGFSDSNGVAFVNRKTGQRFQCPFSCIGSIQLNSDIQTVNTGGGRSVSGAVVGGIVAGPVGAVIGGNKKTKVKEFDHSTVLFTFKALNDREFTLIFKGGQDTYNKLNRLLAPSL